MPENISTLQIFFDSFDSKIKMKYFFIVNLEINQWNSVSSIETSSIFRLNCAWLCFDCLGLIYPSGKDQINWVKCKKLLYSVAYMSDWLFCIPHSICIHRPQICVDFCWHQHQWIQLGAWFQIWLFLCLNDVTIFQFHFAFLEWHEWMWSSFWRTYLTWLTPCSSTNWCWHYL